MKKHPIVAAIFIAASLGAAVVPFVSSAAFAAGALSYSTEADMKTLIGQNIKNGAGDTVGEVKAVHVDTTGKITNVIVGVGGFLGVSDKEVAIKWTDIAVSNEGKDVTTAISKDALNAMPEYK